MLARPAAAARHLRSGHATSSQEVWGTRRAHLRLDDRFAAASYFALAPVVSQPAGQAQRLGVVGRRASERDEATVVRRSGDQRAALHLNPGVRVETGFVAWAHRDHQSPVGAALGEQTQEHERARQTA
jgi:hypothetical protein